jgi:hypothetical protein
MEQCIERHGGGQVNKADFSAWRRTTTAMCVALKVLWLLQGITGQNPDFWQIAATQSSGNRMIA